MRIIGLCFAEQSGARLRWLCGVVADFGDGAWAYAELRRELWIPCPDDCVPETVLATLHERLTRSRN